jgi:hypothetical protein
MSTTTFPVSGTFGGRKSHAVRRAPVATPVVRAKAAPVAHQRTSWTSFLGNALSTWATAGRLPVSE